MSWKGDLHKAGIDANGSTLTITKGTVTMSGALYASAISTDAIVSDSIDTSAVVTTSVNTGVVSGTGVTVVEQGDGVVHKTILSFVNTPIVLADNAGVTAFGSLKVYTFPVGYTYVIGASSRLAVTASAAGVTTTFDGDFGIGIVAADNGATPLATTEQNIIPNTATPQAVARVTTANAVSTATEHAIFDGHTTAVPVYINMLVDDADHDVTTTPTNLILNGEITILWTSLGDN